MSWMWRFNAENEDGVSKLGLYCQLFQIQGVYE